MLHKIIFAAVLCICFASGMKMFTPQRYGYVQNFDMDMPKTKENVEDKNLMDLQPAMGLGVLLRGAPIGNFQPEQTMPLLKLLEPIQHSASGRESLKLQSYAIQNCSASAAEKATFVVRKLQITPDPIHLPGEITFSFDLNLLNEIDNLQVAVELKKKVGQTYVKIPCIGNVGSCSYDVCQLLSTVSGCPPELVAHKIDCKCPFQKNVYDVPGISAEVQVPIFVGGDYQVKATMTSGAGFVGCYNATFSVLY